MDIKNIIAQLTLEEKASLCSGVNHWDTQAIDRLGIEKAVMSDGPHGLRRQDNYNDRKAATTRPAICFPTASALAASFDRALLAKLGAMLGDECQANDTQMLLGPGVNMKRSPLCGRNFEYFSEDPYLAGELAASYVAALQNKGVSACVKHFAANNQEFRRMSCNSIVDERTLREIYLPAFEATVRKGGAKSLMCSYNRINDVYACENKWLLSDVLRGEWGFDGMVVTDWGAMNDRIEALKAGLNLEMPSSNGVTDKQVVAAVKEGRLEEAVLDGIIEEFLSWLDWCLSRRSPGTVDLNEHHDEARAIAAQCAVLLKNDDALLPLNNSKKIAFIGHYARHTQYQGGGSSHIVCHKIDSALDTAVDWADITYCEMFDDDGPTADWNTAITAATEADIAVVFAALPSSYESECFDRDNLDLPSWQNDAIAAVAAIQPNTVVVLYNGSPVTMPWLGEVKSVLEMYLGGEAAGSATADVLFGKVNPSGKLPESFPLRIEDTPAWPDYGKNIIEARYSEGLYVGYRHYDVRKLDVLFPFGHGLSYTTFSLGNVTVDNNTIAKGGTVTVSVEVTNTGDVAGKETVQLYVGFNGRDTVGRPLRQLKGFEKVELQPGETKTVSIPLDSRAFSYYETRIADWYMEAGEYTIYIGTSSRDLPLQAVVTAEADPLPLGEYDTLTVGDLLDRAKTDEQRRRIIIMSGRLGTDLQGLMTGRYSNRGSNEMMRNAPLHSLRSYSSPSTEEEVLAIVEEIRNQ